MYYFRPSWDIMYIKYMPRVFLQSTCHVWLILCCNFFKVTCVAAYGNTYVNMAYVPRLIEMQQVHARASTLWFRTWSTCVNHYSAFPGIIILVIYTLVVTSKSDLALYYKRLLSNTVDNDLCRVDNHGCPSLSESWQYWDTQEDMAAIFTTTYGRAAQSSYIYVSDKLLETCRVYSGWRYHNISLLQ